MHVHRLELHHFKNHTEKIWCFPEAVNALVGRNGAGKTNVLEALYSLAFSKSFLTQSQQQNIEFDQDFFRIEGEVSDEISSEYKTHLKYVQPLQGKKKLFHDGVESKKVEDYVGKLPLVLISPYDNDLVNSGSPARRKFIDATIGQVSMPHFGALSDFQKLLTQRNTLLKFFQKNGVFDEAQLEVLDLQLGERGQRLYYKRKECISELNPFFADTYRRISGQNEEVFLSYKSHLHEMTYQDGLVVNRAKDRARMHTSFGVHRDDAVLEINGREIQHYGSQGQQKTALIALKIAQFLYLQKYLKTKPIVLLDDVFDKLDEQRVERLLSFVNDDTFGQVFITDTHEKRMQEVLSQLNVSFALFAIA